MSDIYLVDNRITTYMVISLHVSPSSQQSLDQLDMALLAGLNEAPGSHLQEWASNVRICSMGRQGRVMRSSHMGSEMVRALYKRKPSYYLHR